MSEVPAPLPTPSALGFSLSLVEGKGVLGLRGQPFFDVIAIEELELEIPGLRFPFDLTGGPSRFRRKRCRMRGATLVVTERRLDAWLRARPGLAELGVEELGARVVAGGLRLAGRL